MDDVQGDNRWMSLVKFQTSLQMFVEKLRYLAFQHNRFVSEARESEPEILWLGDSIIQQLVNSNIWEKR